jgi:glutamate-1-semialdehyde 2,1-aminomutase
MDSYGSTTDKDAGILPEIRDHNYQFAWTDIEQVVTDFSTWNDLACVMVEVPALPWGTDDAVVTQGLEKLKTLAWQRGALFVLDEIVTWPRYGIHGAQDLYGVTPDLCTVSKGIANGLPLAALVGKREYMEFLNQGTIFGSWTFAGETTALAACKATLETCRDTDALRTIRQQGQRLGDGLQRLIQEYGIPAQVCGNYARIAVRWEHVAGITTATAVELRTLWLQHHAKLGILHGIGVMFVNSSWNDTVTNTVLRVAEDTCRYMETVLATDSVQGCVECPVITDVMSVR